MSDIRNAVFEMCDGRCAACSTKLLPYSGDPRSMHVDHVVPSSLGGADDLSNYQPLCRSCNLSKGNRSTADYRPTIHQPVSAPPEYKWTPEAAMGSVPLTPENVRCLISPKGLDEWDSMSREKQEQRIDQQWRSFRSLARKKAMS